MGDTSRAMSYVGPKRAAKTKRRLEGWKEVDAGAVDNFVISMVFSEEGTRWGPLTRLQSPNLGVQCGVQYKPRHLGHSLRFGFGLGWCIT